MSQLKEIRAKALVNVKEIVEQNEEKIKEAYEWILRLACKARKEGLLALEYDAGFIPKDLPLCNHITEMIEMICDGTEPDFLEELMTVRFLANNYTGIEALLFFLYARCMLKIQEGVNPIAIEDFINAIVSGTDLLFHKRHDMWEEEKKQKIENWKKALTEKEKELLNHISMQLQELSEEEWKVAVGCNGVYGFDKILPFLDAEMQELVKSHMNEYRYYSIMRMPEFVRESELFEITEELKKLTIHLKEKRRSILDGILNWSDKEIQLLLSYVDHITLSIALKGVSEEVAECFFRNLSSRLKYIVQERMEYVGPVRMCEVEVEQKKIVQIAKNHLEWKYL